MLKLDNWSDVAQLMKDANMSFALVLDPKLETFVLSVVDRRTGRSIPLGRISFPFVEDKGFNPMNHVLDLIREALNNPKHAETVKRVAEAQAKLRKLEEGE